ncbi:DoxX family protein [Corynebacterium uberis]|uniref:DoxX family protein n=1 Tax=Corynebacterium TaxID=1716 RepID=UPI001D09C7FA|nr:MULTISPECIES: DoxX family protein [Corynebacterium]MCZ9308786.1 DoxX family protein [Corynebacterium sp. c6VSa_13]UDL72685.1 DoxX family protein [Corynebacterium uberis]UDL76439.1 DoxX family protein [Corynebacterium uberis]UDL78651.1 DoxX family protein [Corynebacterium uberis]UDL80930.1 DoxX family protein [Corynebacterium uberis]
MDRPVVRDAALLIFRAILGLVFIVHGWRILFQDGITATAEQFAAWGVPQATVSTWIAGVVQLLGGGLLVVGLLSTIVAGALALLLVAALYFVHLGPDMLAAREAVEFPVVMLAGLLMIVVFGAGRASVDGVLTP